MNEDPNKVMKNIITVFVILIAIKFSIGADAFRSKDYKGRGYSVVKPIGWEMVINDNDPGIFVTESVDSGSVTFLSPEKDPDTLQPTARISVYEAKMATPAWIDDLFPEVMKVLFNTRARVRSRGELKVDGQIAKWVLYSMKGSKDLLLEFYVADEKSGLYKIRFVAQPKAFMAYRKVFDDLRDSFKFSTALF